VSAAQPLDASVIDRLPFEQYVRLEGVHATGLKDMHVSPRLYWRRRQAGFPDNDTLRLGRAGHTAVLEPDTFLLNYAVWRKSDGKVRNGKKWEAFQAANGNRTILTERQYFTALGMRDAARAHPVARKYLEQRGQAELTIRWVHPRTGVSCVSRIDLLTDAIIDIKTTKSTAPGKFSSDAARYCYPLQLAFYADAVAAAGLGARPTKILAIQNIEPFDVAVFDVDEDVLGVGRDQYENALDKLIECEREKRWPGTAEDGEVKLFLPSWAAQQEEGPDESLPIEDDVAF
jgi:exodeoxyribonuclease VIII